MRKLKEIGEVYFFVSNAAFMRGWKVSPNNKQISFVQFLMWLRFCPLEQCIPWGNDIDRFLLLVDNETDKIVAPKLVKPGVGGMAVCDRVVQDQTRFFDLAHMVVNQRLTPLDETFTPQEFIDAVKVWPMRAIAYEMPDEKSYHLECEESCNLIGKQKYTYLYLTSKQNQSEPVICKWIEV